MRAHEFILLEYKRDITREKLGNMIINALKLCSQRDIATTNSGDLYSGTALVKLDDDPEDFDDDFTMSYRGNKFNKQNTEEMVKQFRSNIIDDFLAAVEEKDPSPTKEYTPWLAKVWATSQGDLGKLLFEDMNRNDALRAHYVAKKRNKLSSEFRDIGRFKDYYDFEDKFTEEYDIDEILGDPEKKVSHGAYEDVYEDSTVRIVSPRDTQAACYYGRGTKWCTAATRGTNYFDVYNNIAPLYILLPKKPEYPGERYQLWFDTESNSQFMNQNDKTIDVGILLTKRFPLLLEVFKRMNDPRPRNYLSQLIGILTSSEYSLLNRGMCDAIEVAIDDATKDFETMFAQVGDYREWAYDLAIKRGYDKSRSIEEYKQKIQNDPELSYRKYSYTVGGIYPTIEAIRKYSPEQVNQMINSVQNQSSSTLLFNDLPKVYGKELKIRNKNKGETYFYASMAERRVEVHELSSAVRKTNSFLVAKVGDKEIYAIPIKYEIN